MILPSLAGIGVIQVARSFDNLQYYKVFDKFLTFLFYLSDYREDGRTVDLFLKFRQLRPYLLSRLKKIKRERKEWDYREEVEDMKYLLSVMANMSADE